MSAAPLFMIHADLDGYLDDPVMGPLNELIYETILELQEPNAASNRHYPLRHPALVVFKESYSMMNEFAKERHPEEDFARKQFLNVRDRLLDTYAAELVLSVVFVLLSQQDTKKSRRLISAIKRAVDVNSAYFKAFEKLARKPLPNEDWRSKYLALQEQYYALSALYQSSINTPPVTDKHNQFLLSFDTPPTPRETANDGLVQVKDLLNAAIEANTSDLFQVLRIYLADAQGNLLSLVKVRQEIFQKRTKSLFASNLALSKSFTKIDCIRVFRALFEAGKITARDGSKLTLKEYFKTIGDLLDVDFSEASTTISTSMADSYSADKHTAIFTQLSNAILTLFNSK